MARRTPPAAHRYEVQGTLQGYFWVCSCSAGSTPDYPDKISAEAAAKKHVELEAGR